MMDLVFNAADNVSDVAFNVPKSSHNYHDYQTSKTIGQSKGGFSGQSIDYPYQWYGNDDLFPTNNSSTSSYKEEDGGLLNCSEQLNFLREMNQFVSPSQVVVPAVYCCICLIGLVGNGLVMFVIFGSKEMTKTVANIYIWNLALADTLFLVCLPFTSTQRILLSWPFGAGMCKIVEAVKYLNYFASVFFLTAMSIDRYIAVVYVVTSNKWRTSRNTFFICAAIWSVSLILIIPLLIYTEVHTRTEGMCSLVFNQNSKNEFTGMEDLEEKEMDWIGTDYSDYEEGSLEACDKLSYFTDYTNVEPIANVGTTESANDLDFKGFMEDLVSEGANDTEEYKIVCKHPDSSTFHVFLIFNFVVGFVIPFFIITICYILIVARLVKPSEARTRSKQAERTRRKVTRMVVVLVVAFFLCWLPFYVWHMVQIVGVEAYIGVCHNIRDFTFCLGYANSCLNPILYTFLGHNFKERLRKTVAMSLRSFSFHTFTRSSHTVSRGDTGANSKAKMEGSHTDGHHHAHSRTKATQPLRQVKETERLSSKHSSTNAASEKLVRE